MMRISHKTYRSCPDKAMQFYRVCIDPTTSKSGSYATWYTCMCYFKVGEQISVSKFNKAPGGCTKKWAENEIRVTERASAIARKFNNTINSISKCQSRLEFLELRMAKLDETATFCRKRQVGDFYTFQPKLDNFKRFIDRHGLAELRPGLVNGLVRRNSTRKRTISESSQTCVEVGRHRSSGITSQTLPDPVLDSVQPPPYCDSPPSYEQSEVDIRMRLAGCHFEREGGTCPDFDEICQHGEPSAPNSAGSRSGGCLEHCQHELLHAFVHYHFTQTQGEIAICDLGGTQDDGCHYTLTSPTLHSLDGRFGAKDKGEAGIREVIQHHTCTRWCRHLADMRSLFDGAIARSLQGSIATTSL
ncbi:unnamed protein product [Lymnaea stagnalis]|uniref:Alpha-type protein kinase domain-containing protein n=1 Tax=Lymnaea stagnalis TaxID=6523 RepID=A0AAV2H335_LYMST